MDKDKCPSCGSKLKVTKDIDNLPEVVLLQQPERIAIFKQCKKCKYFFAKWFAKLGKELEK